MRFAPERVKLQFDNVRLFPSSNARGAHHPPGPEKHRNINIFRANCAVSKDPERDIPQH
jgi:hypothetical protein